nr:TSUP family transporter [bacterium]
MTELSGILCSLWLIPLVGLLGGFLAGLIGVGGGILITPILITLGLPARIIAGTMPMVIITNSLSTLRQLRPRELLDFRLGGLLGLSGAIGGFLGAMLVHYLETTADVDRIIQVMFVILLLLAMLRLLFASDQTGNINKLSFLVRLPLLQFYTPLAGRRISLLPLLLLGLLIGAVAGMMGVGGAILLTPALILLLGLDIKQASALAAIFILITTLFNDFHH